MSQQRNNDNRARLIFNEQEPVIDLRIQKDKENIDFHVSISNAIHATAGSLQIETIGNRLLIRKSDDDCCCNIS